MECIFLCPVLSSLRHTAPVCLTGVTSRRHLPQQNHSLKTLWIKMWPKNFQREIVGVCPLSGKGSFWRLFQTKVYKWCSSHLPWSTVVVEMHLWTTFFRENCFNITYIFPFSFIVHHTDHMRKSWEKACICLVLVIRSGCMWHGPPGLAIRTSIPSSRPLHSLFSFGTSWWLTTAITEPLL